MEKRDKRQKIRTVLILEVLLFFSGLLIYSQFVFGDRFLAFGTFADVGSDTVQQYLMHYHSVVNHIRDGNVSFWDFNNGFGVNMFQMNLFDPTLILLYLIGLIRGSNHIWGALVYVQILRILMAGLASYLFLPSLNSPRGASSLRPISTASTAFSWSGDSITSSVSLRCICRCCFCLPRGLLGENVFGSACRSSSF